MRRGEERGIDAPVNDSEVRMSMEGQECEELTFSVVEWFGNERM